MAGNNARVDAGYPQIGVTREQKIDLLRSTGYNEFQAADIIDKRDYLSMPRETMQPVIASPDPKQATIVPAPKSSQTMYDMKYGSITISQK